MEVRKSNGKTENYSTRKLTTIIKKVYKSAGIDLGENTAEEIIESLNVFDGIPCSNIRKQLEDQFTQRDEKLYYSYKRVKDKKDAVKDFVTAKTEFINNYKKSSNTANATIDDNSNVANKNIGILNAEIHKSDNIQISRGMVMHKLKELFPDFDEKQYLKDLEDHIIYKHDESSFAGAIAPYCCSISMYPFLNGGLKDIGGLSAAPKNIDSFCGMYVNLIFATSAMFAGAVATSEFLLYFTYFAKKEWGEDFWQRPDEIITKSSNREKSIRNQIHQYWQQVIYSINQPAAARGLQSAFVNFSYFDKPFFEGMFGNFYFPDGTQPDWESLNWIQKEFMMWFNNERLKTMLTFPVESFALVYKDGDFVDKESAKFVAEEYSRGHSFFTYISDSVDSLSSCCFAKDQKVLWKSSTTGVNLTTLEELHNLKWETDKKNLRIYHNGSWVAGKSIKLPNTNKMYRVVTHNNKEFIMTDNHINVTLGGEKQTAELTTDDYLMFNTVALQAVPEMDEKLSYAQGFVIGAFLGDGCFGAEIKGTVYDIEFSQNIEKYPKLMQCLDVANLEVGGDTKSRLGKVYNNVYSVSICSKNLAAFIMRWTNWARGTYAFNKKLNLDCLLQSFEFRKGILDGWYNTDGGNSNRCYTTSPELAEDMETLITSLGMQSIIDISDRTDEKVIIRGESYDRNYPLYCVRWYEPANHRSNKDTDRSWIKKNNSIYFKIKSIDEIEYTDPVYCIESKNQEEPYFTLPSGLITHNCRLKNKVQTKEFNFTNGNMGVETGSKSVITLNLSRIIQNWARTGADIKDYSSLKKYMFKILERVYLYHVAYNELLWDMYDSNLLPVYRSGFIDLNKQYLTIGLNGLNQSAEFLGIKCNDNPEYEKHCQNIFGMIKEFNEAHKGKFNGHQITLNTECVPAESLAIKNYNWDKADGYWVPEDTNLYASYIYKPNDEKISVLEKLRLHGSRYIGDYLDGGSAAHINLAEHLTTEQYEQLLKYAAEVGCQYLTWNIPNCECECGFIAKQPFKKCPKCGSTHVFLWDRIIG